MTKNILPSGLLTRLLSAFTVIALSLALLTYIGYGESLKTYSQLQNEKMIAQGEIIQGAMENMLQAGLPMHQFVGFNSLAGLLIYSDDSLYNIYVTDSTNNIIFQYGKPLASSERLTKVQLPLRNKFETLGQLTLTMPTALLTQKVKEKFIPLIWIAILLAILFATMAGFWAKLWDTEQANKNKTSKALQIAYTTTFLIMAVAVITAMITLYSGSIQTKTQALANSLGQRVATIFQYRLEIADFEGLDQTFVRYQELNPEISEVALLIDEKITIHTDPETIGNEWQSTTSAYQYVVNLGNSETTGERVRVAVSIPLKVLVLKVARSSKNFAVLFVASAFLSLLFLQIAKASTVRGKNENAKTSAHDTALTTTNNLEIIKPVFFIAVFSEALNASFLPQLLQRIASQSGLPETIISTLFMVYFLCFALTLIPAGRYADQVGSKPLLVIGMILATIAQFIMIFANDLASLTAARALSGIGQGLIFIGVQSYILNTTTPGQRTQGAGIIVFGFNGGIISGAAIGALLVIYIGESGVFTTAGIVAAIMTFFIWWQVPNSLKKQEAQHNAAKPKSTHVLQDLFVLLRDFEFIKTIVLVGLPTKAVLTGITIFALPLVLSQLNFAQEDIGQVIMLYAAGVLLVSRFTSRWVDRFGHSSRTLIWGSTVGGIALLMIGFGNYESTTDAVSSYLGNIFIIAGVLILGMAHGCINAPVVTHIMDTKAANQIGSNVATATFRFLERFGHVAGPIIVGQLLIFTNYDPLSVAYIGVAIILCGLLFALPTRRTKPSATGV